MLVATATIRVVPTEGQIFCRQLQQARDYRAAQGPLVTLEITSYDGSWKSRSFLKFVRPTSLTAPVRAAVLTSERRRKPAAGEDRHRFRRAEMTPNVPGSDQRVGIQVCCSAMSNGEACIL